MGSHTRASPLCRYIQPPPAPTTIMTQVQGSNLLDVLKKKMRQTKEEMEKYKEESENMARKLQVEITRREEAEGEVAALNRRIQLLEEDLERSEEKQVPEDGQPDVQRVPHRGLLRRGLGRHLRLCVPGITAAIFRYSLVPHNLEDRANDLAVLKLKQWDYFLLTKMVRNMKGSDIERLLTEMKMTKNNGSLLNQSDL